MVEAHQGRAKSVALRREILEKQKMKNYQTEYDRIRSHLSESKHPFQTQEKIKSRTEHLKSLGAKAVSGIV